MLTACRSSSRSSPMAVTALPVREAIISALRAARRSGEA